MRRLALSALAFLMLAFAGLTAGSTPASAGECEYVRFADGIRREVNKFTGELCNRWPPNTRQRQPYYPQQGGGYPSPSGGCVGFVAGSQNGIVGFQVCGN